MKSFKKPLSVAWALIFIIVGAPSQSRAVDDTNVDPFVGKWRMNFKGKSDCVLFINPDGGFKMSRPGYKEKGNWICVNPKSTPRKYELTYSGGRMTEQYYLSGSGKELTRITAKGVASKSIGTRIE